MVVWASGPPHTVMPRTPAMAAAGALALGVLALETAALAMRLGLLTYLVLPLARTVGGLAGILTGAAPMRQLFHDGAGTVAPLWERVISIGGRAADRRAWSPMGCGSSCDAIFATRQR